MESKKRETEIGGGNGGSAWKVGKGKERRKEGKQEGRKRPFLDMGTQQKSNPIYTLTMNTCHCDFSLLLQTSHISLIPTPPPILILILIPIPLRPGNEDGWPILIPRCGPSSFPGLPHLRCFCADTGMKSSANKGLNVESMCYAASV